ncbi:TetR/AcrR family transcriptional regulator [Dyella sp.]|uniref:TetR/AcrR family transcriptional regulator n=1 Tax=Dyella sp. TaxID=1869338 RepID=UPI002ED5AA69
MANRTDSSQRRGESLSRDRIIEASIEILDTGGEGGLTFRALSEKLATGPGAIYWHVANKNDLLVAACDVIVARTMQACMAKASPEDTIRAIALGMFDAMNAHPWVGSALVQASGQLPGVRIVEGLGQSLRALGVPDAAQWPTVSALLNYILGVGGQNAANTQFAIARGLERSSFLHATSTTWSQLDADAYPFTRSMAAQLPAHDDRADFMAGIEIFLSGVKSSGARSH